MVWCLFEEIGTYLAKVSLLAFYNVTFGSCCRGLHILELETLVIIFVVEAYIFAPLARTEGGN